MPNFNQDRVESTFGEIPSKGIYKMSVNALGLAIGRLKIKAAELPDGPAVYVPSHRSMIDIPAVGYALYKTTRQPIRFMAKRELFDNTLLAMWMKQCGALPITREAPTIDELKPFVISARNGANIGVFGEGTRGKGPEIGTVHRGPLFIAHSANLPVVPVGVAGSAPFERGSMNIVFGNMIEADEVHDLYRQKELGAGVLRLHMQDTFDIANQIHENSK